MEQIKASLAASVLGSLVKQGDYEVNDYLAPKLLTNTAEDNLWGRLKAELQSCRSFKFAVAFITLEMLVPLKVVLADLAKAGVTGQLVTSTYLGFNSPAVFRELLKLPNVTVKIASQEGFHAKGYLFDHGDYQTAIIGSANFTRAALLKNAEWNLAVSSLVAGGFTREVKAEFTRAFDSGQVLDEEWLKNYQQTYQAPKVVSTPTEKSSRLKPNSMQAAALKELAALRAKGAKKSLVISATGTGKTYLGAFDVKQAQVKRFLFVVHREQILTAALKSFRRVLGGPASDYGILGGGQKQLTARYLFATVQTLSKPEVLAQFEQTEFDYILIDEAHHVGAKTYQAILNYFQPEFLLGMTATPERNDDLSVFANFDYQVAYEIRLQDALQAGMLTPFHYVGLVDYELTQTGETNVKGSLQQVAVSDRLDYLLEEINYYQPSSQPIRGLMFVSRQDEARQLAQLLTKRGYPSLALTNQDSVATRLKAVSQLEAGQLTYLVTVDIFNEGIDIPSVNQVVFLRNTESSIVFAQQLGRGLRKAPGKEAVLVLDFIGNYQNNYLIPQALSGDRSASKDKAYQTLFSQTNLGLATINFSKIAQEQIFQALAKVKLDAWQKLKAAYQSLSARLNRPALLMDFQRLGDFDAQVFARLKLPNYGHFLQRMGQAVDLSTYEDQVLTFVTKELLLGLRPQELTLLKQLVAKRRLAKVDFKKQLQVKGWLADEGTLAGVENILGLGFFKIKAGSGLKSDQYGHLPLAEIKAGSYHLNAQLQASLDTNHWFKLLFSDALEAGLTLNQAYDNHQTFTRFQRYSRKDVCRLLNLAKDVSAPMYGYKVFDRVCPVFIIHQKLDQTKRAALYQNNFSHNDRIRWYTRSPRHLDSPEVKQLLAKRADGSFQVQIELFVKPSDSQESGFYYLGPATIVEDSVKEESLVQAGRKPKQVVGMDLKLTQALSFSELQRL